MLTNCMRNTREKELIHDTVVGFFLSCPVTTARVLLSRHAGANLMGCIRLLSIRTYLT
jgi:hypothetical protein